MGPSPVESPKMSGIQVGKETRNQGELVLRRKGSTTEKSNVFWVSFGEPGNLQGFSSSCGHVVVLSYSVRIHKIGGTWGYAFSHGHLIGAGFFSFIMGVANWKKAEMEPGLKA